MAALRLLVLAAQCRKVAGRCRILRQLRPRRKQHEQISKRRYKNGLGQEKTAAQTPSGKTGARGNTVLIGGQFDIAFEQALLGIRAEEPNSIMQSLIG